MGGAEDLTSLAASAPLLAQALGLTLQLCVMSLAVSAIAGHAVMGMRASGCRPLRGCARVYVSAMRGTPVLVQLFVFFFALPIVGAGGRPMLAAVLAIGLNSAAYVAEILRGNLAVVSVGQREAAQALGLSGAQVWMHVVLPQVWRASLPAFVNEFTLVLKTTPLASAIGVAELTYTGQMITARTFRADETLLAVALTYLVIALPVMVLARHLPYWSGGTGTVHRGAR